jgi:hypothetical protein
MEVSAKTDVGINEVFDAIITDILTLGGDSSKGSGGGSVLGGGRTATNDLLQPQKKKGCIFL